MELFSGLNGLQVRCFYHVDTGVALVMDTAEDVGGTGLV
jgi:hypothetical protein